MAAIEKICEFSGEYGSYDMYNWKRTSIQIMPHHRKKFRGCNSVLYITKKPDDIFLSESKGFKYFASHLKGKTKKEIKRYIKENYEKGYIRNPNTKVIYRYEYWLQVENDELQGRVEGRYFETSFHLKTVIRKIKRLTRNYRLKIIYI